MAASDDYAESELAIELETLQSMFGADELEVDCSATETVRVVINLQPQTGEADAAASSFVAATLTVRLPPSYPGAGYELALALSRTRGLAESDQSLLLEELRATIAELSEEGVGCVWTVIDQAREFLSERNVPGECPICLDEVGGDECFRAPCYHCFHRSCVGEWWRRKALQMSRESADAATASSAVRGAADASAAIGGWHPSRTDVEDAAAKLQQFEARVRALDQRCTVEVSCLGEARAELARSRNARDAEAALQAKKTQQPLAADIERAAGLEAALLAATVAVRECSERRRAALSEAKDGRWAVDKLRASASALADGWRALVSGTLRCAIACPVCNTSIPFAELEPFAVAAAGTSRQREAAAGGASSVSEEVYRVASAVRAHQSELAASRVAQHSPLLESVSVDRLVGAAPLARTTTSAAPFAAVLAPPADDVAAHRAVFSSTPPAPPTVSAVPRAMPAAAASAAPKPAARRRRGKKQQRGSGSSGSGSGSTARRGGGDGRSGSSSSSSAAREGRRGRGNARRSDGGGHSAEVGGERKSAPRQRQRKSRGRVQRLGSEKAAAAPTTRACPQCTFVQPLSKAQCEMCGFRW